MVNRPVENVCASCLEPCLSVACNSLSINDVKTVLPLVDQFGEQFRWILQVRIDDSDGITARVVQARRKGDFLAEVAAEIDNSHPSIGSRECAHHFPRCVAASIVDIEDLGVCVYGFENSRHAAMKLGQDFLFVIGRHNHREKEALSNGDNSDVIVGHRMSARSATDEMRIPNAAR